jgi:hypothetical protein
MIRTQPKRFPEPVTQLGPESSLRFQPVAATGIIGEQLGLDEEAPSLHGLPKDLLRVSVIVDADVSLAVDKRDHGIAHVVKLDDRHDIRETLESATQLFD